jgi:hypothetical protein
MEVEARSFAVLVRLDIMRFGRWGEAAIRRRSKGMLRVKGLRCAVIGLAMTGLFVVPSLGLASSKPTVYYASALSKKTTCKKTGISGPTGAVQLSVYALKGKHPSKSAVACSRAIAVAKAGKKYMFANLSKSYGKTFSVQGTGYQVEEFIFVGAAGPSPGFVGAGTVIAASYASGR